MSEGVSAGLCHKDQRVMPLLVTCGDRTIDCLAVDSCNFLDHLVDGPVAEFPHDHRNNGSAEDRRCAVCIHRSDNGAGLQTKLANQK